jgi:hypothetical protein
MHSSQFSQLICGQTPDYENKDRDAQAKANGDVQRQQSTTLTIAYGDNHCGIHRPSGEQRVATITK